METEDRIREAAEAGEVLRVIYAGGSQPGARREIAPISIQNGKVRARCFSSNAVKTFVIDKIEVVEGNQATTAVEWNAGAKPSVNYGSLVEFLEAERNFLTGLGWHVVSSDNTVTLHRRFKTGKPLKRSDVGLDYEASTYDLVAGSDGELREENVRPRQRPWSVWAADKQVTSFRTLGRAVARFLERASALAPSGR